VTQLELFGPLADPLHLELTDFKAFGTPTFISEMAGVPVYTNEYWTAKQRACHSLHEVSYRACFKPQLPGFFIERLTRPGDRVYDPFMGRGTTLLESALLNRVPVGCDVNPLSALLIAPRLQPPSLDAVASRLSELFAEVPHYDLREDLLVFYHPETLQQITHLRTRLTPDPIDAWIRMVATNRLTGHSPGFFSVYTLPPNQAVTLKAQIRINAKRNQVPPVRDVARLILKKSRSLLKDPQRPPTIRGGQLVTGKCEQTPQIAKNSVQLIVTSPPFLDVVDYAADNWLRCWFCGIDPATVEVTMASRVPDWQALMTRNFHEFQRVLKPGGHIAFEVGEVNGGATRLEEAVLPCGLAAGLEPVLILINQQDFTKTANCWGVSNGSKGTNTNRVVLFRKH
jgi:hypothetical protein